MCTSLICCLPNELLAEIFQRCMCKFEYPFGTTHFPKLKQLLEILLPITATCSRWRRVATSTAKLWTSLVVSPKKHFEIESSMIETFLERSSKAPLNFYLAGAGDFVSDWHPDFLQLYALVVPHLQRCSLLSCHYIQEDLIAEIFPLPLMPELRAIIVFGQTPNLSPITLFAHPASYLHLKVARIIGVPVTPFPESSINQLLIARNSTAEGWVLPLIISSSHITSLKLMTRNTLSGSIPSTRISLPRLTYIWQRGPSVGIFLDTPSLDKLHWVRMELRSRNERVSFPSLTKLHLNRPRLVYLRKSKTQNFHFPMLRSLVLQDANEAAVILRAILLPRQSSETPAPLASVEAKQEALMLPSPNLQLITLEHSGEEDIEEDFEALHLCLKELLERYQHLNIEYAGLEATEDEDVWDRLELLFPARVAVRRARV
ncbi:hypothetical protein DL93DRAFT_1320967 [Clavulina sp. PMI_390]|nr:hypothetical protein DL93DRAFT_1320967 [Clavulina sp. PMI_390]